jgi:hypothetical protein
MRNQYVRLWLLGLCSVVMILSCKRNKVDPIDKLMGFYFDYTQTARMKLEKKTDNTIHLTVLNFVFRRQLNATGGYSTYSKDFEFPKCKIIPLDTNGLGDINTDFAKIINMDNNTEMGRISKLSFPGSNGTKRDFYRFEADFFVLDTARFWGYYNKRAD